MKTDELITALARHAGPVDGRAPARRLQVAALAGVAAALPWVVWQLGLNPDLGADARLPMFWVKFVFVVAVVVTSGWLLRRLVQPGAASQRALRLVALPMLAIWGLALVALARSDPGGRIAQVQGVSWDSCPWNIAILSMPALVLVMATVRSLAPTRLRLAGAAAGLFAGALGTLAYLLHCPELDAPFLAIWYVLGMAIPAAIGAVAGPWVLRW